METKEKQQRRAYAKHGSRTSKMMSFRCDGDNLGLLAQVANKGKLINELLRDYFIGLKPEPADTSPKEYEIEEYMT